MNRSIVRMLPLLLLVPMAGCDLIEDVASFSIASGWKTITIDSAKLGITVPGGGKTIPAVACTKDSDCAGKLSCGGKDYTCAAKCGSSGCELRSTVEQHVDVDLSQQIKNQTTASVLSVVTLDRAEYATEANSLSFDTPKINVLVGPNSAATSAASGVKTFGEMPPIKSKTTPKGNMTVTAEGKSAIQGLVKNYKTPFRFFGKANLVFKAGDSVPSGALKLKLQAHLKIQPF